LKRRRLPNPERIEHDSLCGRQATESESGEPILQPDAFQPSYSPPAHDAAWRKPDAFDTRIRLTVQPTAQRFFGWQVAWAALVLGVFGFGLGSHGTGIYLRTIVDTKGLSVSLVSAAVTLHFLAAAAIMPPLATLYRRFGVRQASRSACGTYQSSRSLASDCINVWSAPSYLVPDRFLEAGDRLFVAFVHGPAFDAFRAHEPGAGQYPHVLAQGRRTDTQLLCDEYTAHAVFHEVAVELRREVPARISQPLQNLQPPLVRQRLQSGRDLHIWQFANKLIYVKRDHASQTMTDAHAVITRERIAETERLIRPFVRQTPLIAVDAADFDLPAAPLLLKLELFQHSGSFKARGAFANLLLREIPRVGVVAASGGNHGAAVAYAAHRLGVPATIFVPSISSQAKIERIRAFGAETVVGGDRYADALVASEARITATGALAVHAFDQVETLLGQGTLGLELEAQLECVDTLLVAVGGGGLIGGTAAYLGGRVKIVAVESEGTPTLHAALAAGHPVDAPAEGIAADSLGARRVGSLMFPIASKYISSEVVLVSDDEIRNAQIGLWDRLRVVAEPGGVAAFAAILSKKYRPEDGERVAVIVCGGNTTAVDFTR
jgi:threonine dehydratase